MRVDFREFEPEKDINEKSGVVQRIKPISKIPTELPPKQSDTFVKSEKTKHENDFPTYGPDGKHRSSPPKS